MNPEFLDLKGIGGFESAGSRVKQFGVWSLGGRLLQHHRRHLRRLPLSRKHAAFTPSRQEVLP